MESADELEIFLSSLEDNSILTEDWETTGLDYDAIPLGLSLHQRGKNATFVPIDYFFSRGLPMEVVAEKCNRHFKRLRLIAHNAKYDSMINVMNGIKDESCNFIADTLVMVHLVDPTLDKQLEKRVAEDFGYKKKTFEEILAEKYSGKKLKWSNIDWAVMGDELLPLLAGYAGEDTYWETKLYYHYKDALDADAWKIHNKIEMPMIKILRDAKIRGILIDVPLLNDMGKEAQKRLEQAVDNIYEIAGCTFNLNSPKQKQQVFFEKLKLPIISYTKSGQPSTDADSAEQWAEMGYPIGKALVEYSELQKLLSGYIYAIPNLVDEHNVLRGDLNSCGTRTGRMCIEEHQRVMTVGGLKMIKDMKVGDLVYCYDTQGKVRIRKVLNVWNKGNLPLVKVKYMSSGNSATGEILCTPNHSFLTKNRGWVMAKDLKREKVYHLRRADTIQGGRIRPRLYGTHSFMEFEQETIKREYFKASSNMCLHHKNGVTTDNSIENLEVLTNKEHAKLHLEERISDGSFVRYDATGTHREGKKGEESPLYIEKGKFSLLRMLFVAGGRPTKVPMDFGTYKGKCSAKGIALDEVCKRFNRRGEYVSKTKVEKAANMPVREQQHTLGLGYYRVNELMEYYGVTNHLVLSVKDAGHGVCYDIEVEEFNNFICEELCVHNSSSNPNLQNQPNNHDFPIRDAFIPRPGYVFVNYDYSQLELRVMAHMSKDKKFTEMFLAGRDPHGEVAASLGITRKRAKVANFGVLYGLGIPNFARQFDVSEEEAKDIIDNYHTTYDGFARWKVATENFAKKNGYVKNLFGRKRILSEAAKNPYSGSVDKRKYFGELRQAVNTEIQGTGADIVKLATIRMCQQFEQKQLDAHFLLQVHDEVLIEARIDQMFEIEKVVIDCMENTVKLDVPLIADGKILAKWGDMKDESVPSYPFRFDYSLYSGLV